MTIEAGQITQDEQLPKSEQNNTNIDHIINLTSVVTAIGGLAMLADSISDYLHDLSPAISAYAGTVMLGGAVVLNLSNHRAKKEKNA
ncbi:MAG: hypothetical protein H6793_00215 [Candidatus Nomurabacteria bacterium]|nr:hypothetical protein [Candidatus Saccharibacteria bacterium]USN95581.1 MAG: hypothetical protein H6793_00215 [Candidatus Nomurabacteria bacterium]